MSENKTIKIIIHKDGRVELDAQNFHGEGCAEALRKIQAELGAIESSQKKDEFYQQTIEQEDKQDLEDEIMT